MTTTTVTVEFGSVTFTGAQIRAARLVEEINPLSTELPINTLELTLFSAAGDFSIINPSGFYANLQYKQPLDVLEDINGSSIYMGRFYLDVWESMSSNLATFRAIDAIGLLDSIQYPGNLFSHFPTDTIGDVIADILGPTELGYELDSSLASLDADGLWVRRSTAREALQQVCFRVGAYVTCARSDVINIVPMELASELDVYGHIIDEDKKGLGQPIKLLPLVTGTEVVAHDNVPIAASPPVEIFRETLTAGDHIILLDNLYDSLLITNGTLLQAWVGSAIKINVPSTGEVVIEAENIWLNNERLYSVYNTSLPTGTIINVVRIDDGFLVEADVAQETAQRVYDYYQQRYLQHTRLFAQNVAPGDSVLISSQGSWIGGILERMETDLAGGFISQVEIVGVVASTCENVLTANLTVTTGNDQAYEGCLDTLDFNIDLQGSANLIIN